jgi:Uncharacterized alpha/beta hydrolase domain (DUF2235)
MAKKIVVFADGTGNAFTVQQSNIWRLYESLDQTQPDQIAHYIKGVGTSGFKPFAALDGATGFGVPSNVRKLYTFISWNWETGDELYMFGFSRGAFTIRTLTGLIQHEGLLPVSFHNRQGQSENVSRGEMRRNARMAWRSYRYKTTPPWTLPTIWVTRWVRDALLYVWRCLHVWCGCRGYHSYTELAQEIKAQNRDKTTIKFVGLFDTVEAYGVPLEELRTAISVSIWPITFKNKLLCGKVETARHALSLDDERVTFHPLQLESEKPESEKPERIKEVWFAGVHSDVGGGYPEDDLAHVPLTWMIGELGNSLRFIDGTTETFARNASPYASAHDSRGGLSVFYRYGPRPICGNGGQPPVVHHSVAEKIAFGIERYAPVTLPATAKVLMPDGSLQQIAGYKSSTVWPPRADDELPGPMERAEEAVQKLNEPDPVAVARNLINIRSRRFAYSSLLATVLVIVSLPWTVRPGIAAFRDAMHTIASWFGLEAKWDDLWAWLANADQGSSAFVGSMINYIGNVLPGYAKPWAEALVDRPTVCLIVIAVALLLYFRNSSLRDRIADLARQAWVPNEKKSEAQRKKYGKPAAAVPDNDAAPASGFMASVKRAVVGYVLPIAAVVLIYAALGIVISRSTVTFREGRGEICVSQVDQDRKLTAAKLEPGQQITRDDFKTSDLCWASRVQLQQGQHYTVWIETTEPFFDQALITDIAGFEDISWRHLLALPIRRWWSGDWFQPVARIGNTGIDAWPLISVDGDTATPTGQDAAGNPMSKYFYDDKTYAARLKQLKGTNDDPSELDIGRPIPPGELQAAKDIRAKYTLRKTYVSSFTARSDGEFFLYVNDAIAAIPFWKTFKDFYDNNTGQAKVTIKHLVSAPPS